MSDMFLKASRLKLRFTTSKGDLSVEDLWQLPLTSKSPTTLNLDDIAIGLDAEMKASKGTLSFVRPVESKGEDLTLLKFEIIKFVIETLMAERDAKAKRAGRAAERQKLLELIDAKETEQQNALPLDELRKQLAAFADLED
jgi:hypothetical protein